MGYLCTNFGLPRPLCSQVRPKSRTLQRPSKTEIGTQVAHVTRDSDTTFKVKKVKGQLAGGGDILWRPPAQLVKTKILGTLNTTAVLCRANSFDVLLSFTTEQRKQQSRLKSLTEVNVDQPTIRI